MRIYLDACCYNRLFDDQTQDRIFLETKAIQLIMNRIDKGEFELVGSEALEMELHSITNFTKKENTLKMLSKAIFFQRLNNTIFTRASVIEELGFQPFDSLHIAIAEFTMVSVIITTDDKMVKLASKFKNLIKVKFSNPINFVKELI